MINIINKILRVNEINIYTYLLNYKKIIEKFDNEVKTVNIDNTIFNKILYKIDVLESNALEEIKYIYDYTKVVMIINKINDNLKFAEQKKKSLNNKKTIAFIDKSIEGLNKALDFFMEYIKTA